MIITMSPDDSSDAGVWIPLLGNNELYKDVYEYNPSSIRLRRRDNRRTLRVSCTGRVQMLGSWVHVADVIGDHRILKMGEEKMVVDDGEENTVPGADDVRGVDMNDHHHLEDTIENSNYMVTSGDCLIIFLLCVMAYMVWYTR